MDDGFDDPSITLETANCNEASSKKIEALHNNLDTTDSTCQAENYFELEMETDNPINLFSEEDNINVALQNNVPKSPKKVNGEVELPSEGELVDESELAVNQVDDTDSNNECNPVHLNSDITSVRSDRKRKCDGSYSPVEVKDILRDDGLHVVDNVEYKGFKKRILAQASMENASEESSSVALVYDTLLERISAVANDTPEDDKTSKSSPTLVNSMASDSISIIVGDGVSENISVVNNKMTGGISAVVDNVVSESISSVIDTTVPESIPEVIDSTVAENSPEFIDETMYESKSAAISNTLSENISAVIDNPVSENISAVIDNPVSENISAVIDNSVSENISAVIDNSVSENISAGTDNPVSENSSAVIDNSVSENISAVIDNPVSENISAVIDNSVSENISAVIDNSVSENISPVIDNSMSENISAVIDNSVSENISAVTDNPMSENISAVIDNSVSENISAVIDNSVSENISAVIDNSVSENISAVIDNPMSENISAVIDNPMSENISAVIDNTVSMRISADINNTMSEISQVLHKTVFDSIPALIDNTVSDNIPALIDNTVSDSNPSLIDNVVSANMPGTIVDTVSQSMFAVNTVSESNSVVIDNSVSDNMPATVVNTVSESNSAINAVSEISSSFVNNNKENNSSVLKDTVMESISAVISESMSDNKSKVFNDTVSSNNSEIIKDTVMESISAVINDSMSQSISSVITADDISTVVKDTVMESISAVINDSVLESNTSENKGCDPTSSLLEEYSTSQLTEYAQYLGLQPTVKFRCFKCEESNFPTMPKLLEHQVTCLTSDQASGAPSKPHPVSGSVSEPASSSTNFRITRKVFLCSACGVYFEHWKMFLHVREVHRRHICLLCLGMFSRADKLGAHLASKHSIVDGTPETLARDIKGPFFVMCCLCEKVFTERDDYTDHSCVPVRVEEMCSQCGLSGKHNPSCHHSTPPRSNATHDLGNVATTSSGKPRNPAEVDDDYDIGDAASFCHVNIHEQNTKEASKANVPTTEGGTADQPLANSDEPVVINAVEIVDTVNNEDSSSNSSKKLKSKTCLDQVTKEDDQCSNGVESPNLPLNAREQSDEHEVAILLDAMIAKVALLEENEPKSLETNFQGCFQEETSISIGLETKNTLRTEDLAEMPENEPNPNAEKEGVIKNESEIGNSHHSESDSSSETDVSAADSGSEEMEISMEAATEHNNSEPMIQEDENKDNVEDKNVTTSSTNTLDDHNPESNASESEADMQNDSKSDVEMGEERRSEPLDNIPVAGEEVQALELILNDGLESTNIQIVLRESVKVACGSCVYCNHARRIAVNGKQLALHLLAEHRFTLPGFVPHLKQALSEIQELYLNTDTYDSSNPSPPPLYDKTYECFHCNFLTRLHKELYLHNRKMHQKTILLCIMCKSNFYSYSELLCHLCPGIYVPDSNIGFRCCLCEVHGLPSAFRLMVHLRKRHHACDVCLESTGDQQRLSNHVWKHKLHHLCYRCGIAYRNKPDITKHLFWKHGTESVLCKRCLQKKWPHVYHFCVPPHAFVCEECNASFSRAVALKVHRRVHAKEFPYPCTECSQRFVSRRLLTRHTNSHWEPVVKETTAASPCKLEPEPLPQQEIAKSPEPRSPEPESAIEPASVSETLHSPGEEIKVNSNQEPTDKKDKKVVDVYDLPPLNLSSDSDDSDIEPGPPGPESESQQAASTEEPNQTHQPEEDQPVQPVDGIWDNFQTYLERRDSQQPEPGPSADHSEVLNVVMMDHDYCGPRMQPPVSAEEPPKSPPLDVEDTESPAVPAKIEEAKPTEHNYCHGNAVTSPPTMVATDQPATTPTKKKQKTPRKKQRHSSSSSNSSSDSDSSSCSCGTNCSCSSSSSSSSGSSSSSSDSDSSNSESRRRKEARPERRKVRKRDAAQSGLQPETQPSTEKEADTKEEPIIVTMTPPKAASEEPHESDLDTDETETDEDFYDRHPQRLANKLMAEKRNQLMLLATVAPVNNGTLPQSGPEPPEPPPPRKKFRSKKHKKSQHQHTSSSKKSSAAGGSLKLNIATSMYVAQPSPVPTPPLVTKSVPSPYHSTGSGSETDSKRMSRRRRVPKRFYGDSSEEEGEGSNTSTVHQHRPILKWHRVVPPPAPAPPLPEPPQLPSPEPPTPMEESDSEEAAKASSSSESSESERESSPMPQVAVASPAPQEEQHKNENLYCFCRCPYDEVSEMIACDGKNCAIEWFHFECVGIMVPPKGKWFCPNCRKNTNSKSEYLLKT